MTQVEGSGEHTRPEQNRSDEQPHWLERPATVKRIVVFIFLICALLLGIDPLVHKHGPFEIEHLLGFYGIYGFVGCVFLVLAAKLLRKVLMRPEDYYDR